jgi:hypothetical protein
MGSPYHVSRCDEASAEFQAISLIAESLVHPERALLSAFIQQADDRELAARFFLHDVVGENKATVAEFLADWISLLRKGVSSSSSSSNCIDKLISTPDGLQKYELVTQTELMAER